MGKASANKPKFIKIPKAKMEEMNKITDLMRNLQYQYNLIRKDLQLFQFQTLKEVDKQTFEEVEKGFLVYDIDMQNGQYVVKRTENKEAKAAEIDEAISKNHVKNTSN